jgi:hypothetical protein
MPDSYLAISQIAVDGYMTERMRAATAQQAHSGAVDLANGETVEAWVAERRYTWASSPTWGEKWDYALASNPDDGDPSTPQYQPGADPAVITDADILATVQALAAETPLRED